MMSMHSGRVSACLEREHHELDRAVAVVLVYLRVEGGVHAFALAQAQLLLTHGEHDAVEAYPALFEPELEMPSAAYGRHALEQGVGYAEGRPRVAAAEGLQLAEGLDALHTQQRGVVDAQVADQAGRLGGGRRL